MSQADGRPLPEPTAWSRPFWEGSRRSQLLLPRCRACERAFFYPRPFCPFCLGDDVEWVEASGRGRIYSYTVVRNNPPSPFLERLPFVIAIVRLEEGVQLLSNIVDGDVPGLECDAEVEVVFEHVDDEITLPLFRLART